jgi:hypothetical protein
MSKELASKWKQVLEYFEDNFNKKPDLNAILFIIGMREFGTLNVENFTKDEKVLLMHIAVCKILSYSGHYELEGMDIEGWPKWKLIKPLPLFDIFQQELFLKQHIVEYFEKEQIIEF